MAEGEGLERLRVGWASPRYLRAMKLMVRERAYAGSLALLVIGLVCLGCQAKSSSLPTPDAGAPPPAPTPPEAGAATGAPAASLGQEELDAFLKRWIEAQNKGQFDTYAQLYAEKFYGVKRAGARQSRFARADWLEDRRRMFRKPVSVEARDPVIHAASNMAEIEFTQHFASGNFADVGPKRLLVVREAGGLRIAHEEMLASRETSGGRPALQPSFDFHFLLALESGLQLVLGSAGDLPSHGRVRLEREIDVAADLWTTSRALHEKELEPALRAWKGQRLRLDGGCVAQVSGFAVVSRVVPHFSTVHAWEGRDENLPEPQKALSIPQMAEAAFELGDKVLTAKLTGCSEGTYAQREATPLPKKGEPWEDEGVARRARAAFAKLPTVIESQTGYVSDVEGAKGKWWEQSLKIEMFRHPVSGEVLVSVQASLIGDSCSEFSAREWAVFELRGKALLPLQTAAAPAEIFEVLDVNGDGRLEFLVGPSGFGSDKELFSPDQGGPSETLGYSYLDCPC